MVARGRLQPEGLNARFRDHPSGAVVALDHALCRDQAGCTRAEEIGFAPVWALKAQVDPVESILFGPCVMGLRIEMRVVHFDEKIEEALARTALQPCTISGRARQQS